MSMTSSGSTSQCSFAASTPVGIPARTGDHFAGPGNRFWKVLHLAGLTPWELRPDQAARLLEWGIGITNLVGRTTATAAEITKPEYVAGAVRLRRVVAENRPSVVAILGVGAYRSAFDRRAVLGRQPASPLGTDTFVLPNPSGLQARYGLEALVAMFAEVREAIPRDRQQTFPNESDVEVLEA